MFGLCACARQCNRLNDQRYWVHLVCVFCFAGVVCFDVVYSMAQKCAFVELGKVRLFVWFGPTFFS